MNVTFPDLKGDDWVIMMPGRPSRKDPNVWWCLVVEGPPSVVKSFPEIPIPVFTEWWT